MDMKLTIQAALGDDLSEAATPCPEMAEQWPQNPPDDRPSETGHLRGAQHQMMGLWLWLELMLLLDEGRCA